MCCLSHCKINSLTDNGFECNALNFAVEVYKFKFIDHKCRILIIQQLCIQFGDLEMVFGTISVHPSSYKQGHKKCSSLLNTYFPGHIKLGTV